MLGICLAHKYAKYLQSLFHKPKDISLNGDKPNIIYVVAVVNSNTNTFVFEVLLVKSDFGLSGQRHTYINKLSYS